MSFDGSFMMQFIQQTHATDELTEREKHLIGMAVTITRGCTTCTHNRIKAARLAGISDDTLNAMVRVVAAINAGVAAQMAAMGFEGADKKMSAACTTGVCEVPSNRKA